MDSTIKVNELNVSEFVQRDKPLWNAIAILYRLLSQVNYFSEIT